jgi:peptidoglycan/LPS O-acetylase OafA/YrhL
LPTFNIYKPLLQALQAISTKLPVSKTVFPNLNGVRAIAALAVVISHIELLKPDFNIPRFASINLLPLGAVAVTVFFALSGFLITYLLLEEKLNYQKVSIGRFYLRRVLRIWPLYFLVVFFGYFVYPKADSLQGFWLSLFFLPNLAFCLQLLRPLLHPIWSIGTEEQFYLVHPLFFRLKKVKHIAYSLAAFIACFYLLDRILKHFEPNNPTIQLVRLWMQYARFDNLTIGALFAIAYYNYRQGFTGARTQAFVKFVLSKPAQWAALVAFTALNAGVLTGHVKLVYPVECILASVIIINLCEGSNSILNLNKSLLNYLGKISYSIYLTHKFALYLFFWLGAKYLTGNTGMLTNMLLYAGCLAASILLASATFFLYEKHFLDLKKRFTKTGH